MDGRAIHDFGVDARPRHGVVGLPAGECLLCHAMRRFGALGWLFLVVSILSLFLRWERLRDSEDRYPRHTRVRPEMPLEPR